LIYLAKRPTFCVSWRVGPSIAAAKGPARNQG
jgi:hypothetical protein